jgi:RTX calcium-binding nonapeptide repeat (4 copies)
MATYWVQFSFDVEAIPYSPGFQAYGPDLTFMGYDLDKLSSGLISSPGFPVPVTAFQFSYHNVGSAGNPPDVEPWYTTITNSYLVGSQPDPASLVGPLQVAPSLASGIGGFQYPSYEWVQVTIPTPPLSASGTTFTATEGQSTGLATVATFTDANPNATASDFTATVNWGDGSPSDNNVTITPNGSGGFSVNGSHTYAEEGNDTITVTINDTGGSTATATSLVSVHSIAILDPGPSITYVTPSAVEKGQATEIGTVTPGLAGDTLSLKQTGGAGTLALQLVNGVEEVIYTAPSAIPMSTLDKVSYTITDQFNDVASGSVAVQLDAGPSITSVTPSVVEKGQATEIGTVTPGLAGDTLSLKQTGGAGTLALQLVNGVEEVIYTAPSSVTAGMLDTVTYAITDQHDDAVATGSNTVSVAPTNDIVYVGTAGGTPNVGNGNSAIDGRAGNETINAGNGNDVVFAGSNDTISLGNGNDTVLGGSGDTIQAGNGTDTISTGANSRVTVGNNPDTITVGANSTVAVGNGNDHLTVGNNSTITLGKGTDTVVFQAGIGSATTLSETITGLSAQDPLDFTDINFATVQQPNFSGTTAGGTLTITDGTDTAKINLIGNYLNSSWTLSNDGNGGTIVVDPPLGSQTGGGPVSSIGEHDPGSPAWMNDRFGRSWHGAVDDMANSLVQAIAAFGAAADMHSGVPWQNNDPMAAIDSTSGVLGAAGRTTNNQAVWHSHT